MAYEINVSVFPPAGAGTAIGQGPSGQIVQQVVPAIEYKNVVAPTWVPETRLLEFTLRGGDKIQTNLSYIIRYTKQADEGTGD